MIRQAGVTLQTTGMFRKLLFWQPLERLAHALRCSLPLLLHTGIPPRCAAPMDSRAGQYARNVARPPSCSSSSTTMPRPPLFGLPVQTIYRQTMLHHPIDRHVDNGSSRLSEPCGPSRPRLPRGATPGSSFSTANAARTVIPARTLPTIGCTMWAPSARRRDRVAARLSPGSTRRPSRGCG